MFSDLRMAPVRAWMTASQCVFTFYIASAVDYVPIINILDPYFALVIGTLQRKAAADTPFLTVLRSGFRDLGLGHDIDYLTPYSRLTG